MREWKPSTKALVRLGSIDLAFTVLVPTLFGHTMMVAEPWTAVLVCGGIGLVRMTTWIAVLAAGLAPVDRHASARRHARTDDGVRTSVHALRGAFDRFLVAYALGWFLQIALSVGWVISREGGLDGFGADFAVPGFLVCVTIVLASGVFAYTQTGLLVAELGAPLLVEAESRGIRVTPPSGSIASRVALLALAISLAPLFWLGAIGIRGIDVASTNEARLLATRAALHALLDAPRTGGADASTSPIVGLESAPEAVAGWARRGVAREREGSMLDPTSRRAYAFVRNADGRAAIGSAPIPENASATFLVTLAGFFVVVLVWAPVSAMAFGRDLGEGVGRVTRDVGRLVDLGDLKAMQPLPVLVDDEIGELTRHFNDLVRTLRVLADGAEAVARGELSATIEGRGELPDAFRGMLDGLRTLVGRIRRTALELASAAAEIYSASQEQEAAAAQQSSGITEVSRTMESLASSAAHVAESVGNVLADAERTRTTTEQMATRIAELNAHASRIGELLEVIRDVADRSDLLALNGSLEATRAGEAGRGFSLVAGEMRRLAERVMATVADVRNLVGDVRASGSATVMATEQSRKLAESTSDAARRITFVTQQQRTATEQVTASVREVADVLAQAAAATTQTRVSAETLKSQADELEALLARFQMGEVQVAA